MMSAFVSAFNAIFHFSINMHVFPAKPTAHIYSHFVPKAVPTSAQPI